MGSVAARVALYQTVGTYLAPWKSSTCLRVKCRDIAVVYIMRPLFEWETLHMKRWWKKLGVERLREIHWPTPWVTVVFWYNIHRWFFSVSASKFKDKDEKTGQRKPWMKLWCWGNYCLQCKKDVIQFSRNAKWNCCVWCCWCCFWYWNFEISFYSF